jgi:hypothetical protein
LFWALAEAEVELLLDLQLHDAAAPAVGDGLLDVEIPRGGVLDHLEEPDDVSPRQLRNRLFRNWASGTLRPNLHGQEVAPMKVPPCPGNASRKIGGEAINDPGTPGGFLLAGEDDFPGLPVGFDDDGVGGQHGTHPGLPGDGV